MLYCVHLERTMGLSYTLVFCLALAVVQSRVDWEAEEKYWNKCVAETGAEETMEDVFKKGMIPTSDKGMCLVECMLRAESIYGPDGNFEKEGAKKYLDILFEEQPENIEKAFALLEECSKVDIEGLDKCEAAVKHMTCSKAKYAQANIVPTKS